MTYNSSFSSICLTPDCSGRGSCIVPDGATNNISMCVCDLPWSGKTDILNFDGYDCVDFGLLRQILYGWVAIRHLYNLKYIYLAFKCQLKILQSIKGKWRKKGPIVKHWWQMLSLKVLVSCLVNHFMVVYFSLAMAFGYGVLGGNALASLAYVLASSLGMYQFIPVNIATLKALIAGVGMDKKGEKIIQFVQVSHSVAVSMYSACLLGVFIFLPIYSVSMTEPPNESTAVPVVLILRNISVICLFAYISWLGFFTCSKVRTVIEQRSSTAAKKSSVVDKKIQLLLTQLDLASQNQKKVSIVTAILYTTFSLPWLHPFQGYLYTFTFLQMTGAGHPSRLYMEGGKSSVLPSSRVGPRQSDLEQSTATIAADGSNGQSIVTPDIEE